MLSLHYKLRDPGKNEIICTINISNEHINESMRQGNNDIKPY